MICDPRRINKGIYLQQVAPNIFTCHAYYIFMIVLFFSLWLYFLNEGDEKGEYFDIIIVLPYFSPFIGI